MHQLLVLILSIFYSCLSLAKSNYQIDLILFAHSSTASQNAEGPSDTPFIPMNPNLITLKAESGKNPKPYHLLPAAYSSLKDEYYLLSHKSHYPILGHYSWRQEANNQNKVVLAPMEHNGWYIQGTFRVIQSAYYNFNTNLQISSPDKPKSSFSVSQKQRLKDSVIYYLDNERIGMLVKIHQVT